MDKILAIIKREYLTRVRSKGFVVGTILSPLLMAGLVVVPIVVARMGSDETDRLVVLDQTPDDALYARVARSLDPAGEGGEGAPDEFELRRESVASPAALEARKRQLNEDLVARRIEGYVVVPPDVLAGGKVEFHTKNAGGFGTRSRLRAAFSAAVIEQRLAGAGIDAARVNELSKGVEVETINERGEQERGQSFILAYALLMILYITILVYGITVLRGVVEEKQSRIIEVMLSSVRPFQLMLGKIVGIGLVGLTQYFAWAAFALLLSAVAAAQALTVGAVKLPHISFALMFYFVAYFVLGYFLYATLYAMVGAMVSTEEDGQQVQMPVTMTLVVPMALSSVVMSNPGGTLSTALSLFPFFAPVLMFLRITLEHPPFWQVALSFLLLIATIFGSVWVAAKIYRVGVLMYGKRPTLPELARWLRYT
jgi:ABC-2 type transport system permease protein